MDNPAWNCAEPDQYGVNHRSGRVELVLHGAGNNAAESRQAPARMKLLLYHPDWRPENLARIGDALDSLAG